MKVVSAHLLTLAVILASASASPTPEKRAAPQGVDISHYQGTVNFNTLKANGLSFVYIKATEGTSKSPSRLHMRRDEAHLEVTQRSVP